MSERVIGTVTDRADGSRAADVTRLDDGSVVLTLWHQSGGIARLLPPAERDQLREYLDRAAMPGQDAPGPGRPIVRVLRGPLLDADGDRTAVGIDYGLVTMSEGALTGFTAGIVARWTPDQARQHVADMQAAIAAAEKFTPEEESDG